MGVFTCFTKFLKIQQSAPLGRYKPALAHNGPYIYACIFYIYTHICTHVCIYISVSVLNTTYAIVDPNFQNRLSIVFQNDYLSCQLE